MSSRALRKLTEQSEDCTEVCEDSECSVKEGDGFENDFVSKFSLLGVTPEVQPDALSDSKQQLNSPVLPTKTRRKHRKRINAKKKRSSSPVAATSGDSRMEDSEMELNNMTKSHSVTKLLVVNSKSLDPLQELTRLFGSQVVGASRGANNTNRRDQVKRGLLVRIKPTWPPVVRFGLDMVRLDNGEFCFTHSKDYRNIQKSFYAALETMDPNDIMQILAKYPYHIDSLIQLSDIMAHQDNSEMATDLLERALHAYQSVFHTNFNPAVDIYSLDYRRQENRGLFVALFRYINMVGTRGCYRNALDYSKILLSLNLEKDPLAALLFIDYYALLSRQFDFLLQLYKELNPERKLDLLPNFAYSVPLALHLDGRPSTIKNETETEFRSSECAIVCADADSKLQDALIMFPGFVTRLLKHTTLGGANNLNKSILFGQEMHTESDSLGRLLDLYVARTHTIWTLPDVLSWLERNIETVLKLVEPSSTGAHVQPDPRLVEYSKKRQFSYPALPRNIVRHLILSDLPDAPPLLIRSFYAPRIYQFDPLPPQDAINYCDPDEERARSQSTGLEGGFFYSLFTSLLPDDSLPRAVQHFIQSNRNNVDDAQQNPRQLLHLFLGRLSSSFRHIRDQIDPRRVQDADTDAEPTNDGTRAEDA